jgi:DNA gyrase/topoisomerase IV subunit A
MVYYESMEAIFNEWYDERYNLYVRRKEKLITALELAILILQNRIRFIKEVIAKEIRINKLSNEELENILNERKYYRHNDSFDYLLTMHMSSMTLTNLSRLEKELEAKISELEELRATSIETLWERELDTLIPYIKDLE